jgi:hypothetical protein
MPIALLKKKRGQIKMFESIAMLLVFFFLVAIGLKFYGNIELANLKQAKERFADLDSVKMAIILANLPELKCSTQNVYRGACVDIYKVRAWEEEAGKDPARSYYFDLLGHSTITLEEWQGTSLAWEAHVLHNETPPGNYSTSLTPLPVTVWNPQQRRHTFGVLYVRVHSST